MTKQSEDHFKTLTYATPSWILNDWLQRARQAGYYVEREGDTSAIVRLDGKVYLRALNMRGSWLIRADPAAFKAVEEETQ